MELNSALYRQLAEFRSCGVLTAAGPHCEQFTKRGQYGHLEAHSVLLALVVIQFSLPLAIVAGAAATRNAYQMER